MKFRVVLMLACLLFVFGCSTSYKLKTGVTYYDKNNMYNGISLNKITLNDDLSVEATTCGKDAGCSLYKGTYVINNNQLTIRLNSYQDMTGDWEMLPEEYISETTLTITGNNAFSYVSDDGNKQEYVIE